jgi:hypothetical protein
MNINNILFYLSSAIWFLPLFKQKNTRYFGYFLVLALSDPIGMMLYNLISFHTTYYTLIMLVIKLSFLQNQKNRIKIFLLGVIFAIFVLMFFNSRSQLYFCASVFFFFIIITLALESFGYIKKNKINLFLNLLIFYNAINLFKFIALAMSFEQGAISFTMGYAFQILLGIVFLFINISTKNFEMNLSSI